MTHRARLSIAVTWLAFQLAGCTGLGPVVNLQSSEVLQVRITSRACEPVVDAPVGGFSTVAVALADVERADLERLLPGRELSAAALEGCLYLVLRDELMPGPPRRDRDGRLWHEQTFPRL